MNAQARADSTGSGVAMPLGAQPPLSSGSSKSPRGNDTTEGNGSATAWLNNLRAFAGISATPAQSRNQSDGAMNGEDSGDEDEEMDDVSVALVGLTRVYQRDDVVKRDAGQSGVPCCLLVLGRTSSYELTQPPLALVGRHNSRRKEGRQEGKGKD